MSWDGDFWFPHSVTVRIASGSAGMGSSHAAPVGLRAEVKDEQRLVRASSGAEVVSSTTVTVPLDSGVTSGSLVTVWAGTAHERTSTVIAVQRDENGDPLGSHLILSLK